MPVKNRRRYFDSVVTPVAFLGSGHRTIHHIDLHARGMKLFMIGMESCDQLHWNMVWGVLFYFLSPDLFDRRLFVNTDCFTGQSPGIWHDADHLYAGGLRMCMGEGHIQPVLLRGGQAIG